jgi:hypothetical protein
VSLLAGVSDWLQSGAFSGGLEPAAMSALLPEAAVADWEDVSRVDMAATDADAASSKRWAMLQALSAMEREGVSPMPASDVATLLRSAGAAQSTCSLVSSRIAAPLDR